MSANGGTGETRTRINRVQAGYSPFELRSRGARRNRTFSPGFGGPAGHHDSATHEGLATKRPVAGSNRSHSIDGGAATPVASRGTRDVRMCSGWRTGIEPASAGSRSALVPDEYRHHVLHFVGRRGLAPRSPGLQPGAITRLAHDPCESPRPGLNRSLPLTRRVLVRSSCEGAAPAEGIEPSKRPVNGRLPDHSASLE
jgi:hypothetical protein